MSRLEAVQSRDHLGRHPSFLAWLFIQRTCKPHKSGQWPSGPSGVDFHILQKSCGRLESSAISGFRRHSRAFISPTTVRFRNKVRRRLPVLPTSRLSTGMPSFRRYERIRPARALSRSSSTQSDKRVLSDMRSISRRGRLPIMGAPMKTMIILTSYMNSSSL